MMDEMILEDWAYKVIMQCNGDIWALHGIRIGHPRVHGYGSVSTPAEFDEEKMIIKTFSGSVYKLGNCGGNLKQQIAYIKEDVALVELETNKLN
jgi:hypothetical protein